MTPNRVGLKNGISQNSESNSIGLYSDCTVEVESIGRLQEVK